VSEISRPVRIALLLESFDYYLDPFTIRARAFSGGSGAGPERRVECSRCMGIGRTRSGNRCGQCWHGESQEDHTCEQCAVCAGHGRVWVNTMVGEVVPAPPREYRDKTTGGAKAKRTIEPRDLSDDIHRIERARAKRDRSGSYRPLERALGALWNADEIAHYLVSAYYREQRWGRPFELLYPNELDNGRPKANIRLARLGQAESVAVSRGLMFLDERMPRDIHVPREFLAPLETRAGLSITQQARSKSSRARSRVRRWAA